MTRWNWSTGLAVAVATAMMTCPAAPALAAMPSARTAAAKSAAKSTAAPQFALTADRTLPGVVVNLAGQPMKGATVDLHQHGLTVGKATTAADGTFVLQVDDTAAAGEYQLTVGPQTIPCHIWDAATAPPSARTTAALRAGIPAAKAAPAKVVTADATVRGQQPGPMPYYGPGQQLTMPPQGMHPGMMPPQGAMPPNLMGPQMGPQMGPSGVQPASYGPPVEGTVPPGPYVDGSCPDGCPPGGYVDGGGVPSLTGIDFITLATVGAAGTALVLSIVNNRDIGDLEDEIDDLRDRDPISP